MDEPARSSIDHLKTSMESYNVGNYRMANKLLW